MTTLLPEASVATARAKLLKVALRLLREKGYSATTVDDLCAAAGVTKGAFFHHFKSKEDMAVAAADHWSATTGELFDQAAYHERSDPLGRVLAYLDLRADLIDGAPAEFSCVAGTMAQETFLSHPAILEACSASILGHASTLEADLAEAIATHRPRGGLTARGLAIHTQAVLQGAFILAKATGDPRVAVESVQHLRRYLALLFASGSEEGLSHAA